MCCFRNDQSGCADLESGPFLNPTLQRFTCELYYRFGSFLAPLSIGLITSRHYLSEHGIKNGDNKSDERKANNSDKYTGLGAAITAELMIGFWFGVRVMLAVGVTKGGQVCTL